MFKKQQPGPGGDAVSTVMSESGQATPDANLESKTGVYEAPGQSPSKKYPFSYEELHAKCRDVLPACFEGAKFSVMKGMSNHFQVMHTLTLSQARTGYRFGTTFVGHQNNGSDESYPILMGDMDLQGNTSATIIHKFANNLRVKFQGQTQQNKLVGTGLALERQGLLSHYGITLMNTNLISNSGVMVLHYLRRITEKLDLGAEYVYQRDPKIPGNQISAISYALRYTTPIWTASATLGATNLHLCYHHKQTDNLQFAVDFETNLRAQESVTTFAYQIDIPDSMVFRASVDTNWTVSALLEKRLSRQVPFTFVLSGMLNQAKLISKFGVGLTVG